MNRQENLEYRKSCPYDAMGDFGGLMEVGLPKEEQKEQSVEPEK